MRKLRAALLCAAVCIIFFSGFPALRMDARAAGAEGGAGDTDPSGGIPIPGWDNEEPEGGMVSFSGKWIRDSKGWWYQYPDKSFPKDEWKKIGGKWYHFDKIGYMQTGWQMINGRWYYLAGDGAMRTGWQKIGGKWYYLAGDGAMRTGWQQVGGKWYYMNSSGAMLTGWQLIGGKWYYMNNSGVMQTGWQKIGGKWYFMNGSGVMQTGWQKIGGKWYLFNGSGVMLTGWQLTGGKWYYLGSDGRMRCDEYDDNHRYFLNEDGAWCGMGIDIYEKTVSRITIGTHLDSENYHKYQTLSDAGKKNKIVNLLSELMGSDTGRLYPEEGYYYYSIGLQYTDNTSETVWVFPETEEDYYEYLYCEGVAYFDFGDRTGYERFSNKGVVAGLMEIILN